MAVVYTLNITDRVRVLKSATVQDGSNKTDISHRRAVRQCGCLSAA